MIPIDQSTSSSVDQSEAANNSHFGNEVMEDLEAAIIAVLIDQGYDHSGRLSTDGILCAIHLGRPAKLLIRWLPPSPRINESSTSVQKRKCLHFLNIGCIIMESTVYESIPEHLHEKVCELLARANYGMRVGNFVLDINLGNIIFRSSLHITSRIQDSLIPLIRELLLANVKTHKRYLPSLNSLIDAGETVATAIAVVEGPLSNFLSGDMAETQLRNFSADAKNIMIQQSLVQIESFGDFCGGYLPLDDSTNLYVIVKDEVGMMIVTCQLFDTSPSFVRTAVGELVLRANTVCKVGRFNFDRNDGQVHFRAELPTLQIENQDIPALLRGLVHETISATRIFYPAFQSVIRRSVTSEEAFRNTFQRREAIPTVSRPEPTVPNNSNAHATRPNSTAITNSNSVRQHTVIERPTIGPTSSLNISKFTNIRYLARGGQGIVYHGEYDGNLVAIKQFEGKNSFQEIIAQTKFVNDYIVRVLGVVQGKIQLAEGSADTAAIIVEDDENLLLVTEYCGGGTLRSWIDKIATSNEPFDEITAVSLMLNVARGMTCLHGKSFLHRDLKPENIFLSDEQSKAKIGDFGLAKEMTRRMNSQASADSSIVQFTLDDNKGTLFYIAPESFKQTIFSEKSDVYAFGIILYELFVSRGRNVLFDQAAVLGDGDASQYWNIFRQKVGNGTLTVKIPEEAMNDISSATREELRSLISRCTAVNPAKRPTFETIRRNLADLFGNLRKYRNAQESATPAILMEPGLEHFSKQLTKLIDGGMGSVFVSEYLGMKVALKQPKNSDDFALFEKEIKMHAQFSHPNILSVLGLLRARIQISPQYQAATESQYCLQHDPKSIVMINEYCPEGSLLDFMRSLKRGERRFDELQCVNLMLDVALGMCYLHHKKIFHRDLKPANILLHDGYRKAKIGDFGIAQIARRRQEDLSRSLTYVDVVNNGGSLFFVAPEIYRDGIGSIKSDLFSFGIILFNVFVSWREVDSIPPNIILHPNYSVDQYSAAYIQKLKDDEIRPIFPPRNESKMSPQLHEGIETLAKQCWDKDARRRPSFLEVVESLKRLRDLALQTSQVGCQEENPSINLPGGKMDCCGPVLTNVSYSETATVNREYTVESTESTLSLLSMATVPALDSAPLPADSSESRIRSAPTTLTYFPLRERLSAMESALQIQSCDVKESVLEIARNLDMEEEIKSLSMLKKQVQRLWKEFEDSEEEERELPFDLPSFALIDNVKRVQEELRIPQGKTIKEIIEKAAQVLDLEEECTRLPRIKLRAKRISIEMGYLPEELIPFL